MIYDYRIRESDRPELAHTLTLILIAYRGYLDQSIYNNVRKDLSHKLTLSLLYRKMQFGFMSVEQLFELILRFEVAESKNIFDLTDSPLETPMERFSSFLPDINFNRTTAAITKRHDERMQRMREDYGHTPKSAIPRTVWDTPIGLMLTGRAIYDNLRYFSNAMFCVHYTPPQEMVLVEEPKPKIPYRKELAVLMDLNRVPSIFDTRPVIPPNFPR